MRLLLRNTIRSQNLLIRPLKLHFYSIALNPGSANRRFFQTLQQSIRTTSGVNNCASIDLHRSEIPFSTPSEPTFKKSFLTLSKMGRASDIIPQSGVRNFDGFDVHIIPILEDNFSYLIIDHATSESALVDPAEPELCQKKLSELQQATPQLKLNYVLTTHKVGIK